MSSSFDKDNSGSLSAEEIEAATNILVNDKNISSLKGVEILTSATLLYCSGNSLTSLDLSKNTELAALSCRNNQLTSLDLSANTKLTTLYCQDNQLGSLTLSDHASLSDLNCSNNPKMISLECLRCALTKVDASGCTALQLVFLDDNQISSLNVRGCTALSSLGLPRNKVYSLDLSTNTNLMWLDCSDNRLSTLNLSKKTKLDNLICYNNEIFDLDISNCTMLNSLFCFSNDLGVLDVSKFSRLTHLDCHNCELGELDVSFCPNLVYLDCGENDLRSLEVINHEKLDTLIVQGNTRLTELNCWYCALTTLDVGGCTALTSIDCNRNQLTSLELGGCTSLKNLFCAMNQLESLDFWGNPELEAVSAYDNRLTSVNTSNCAALILLDCGHNQVASLDVSGNPSLEVLTCYDNQLTTLDVTQNPLLEQLRCHQNPIESVDIRQCPYLTDAYLNGTAKSTETYIYYVVDYDDYYYIVSVDPGTEIISDLPPAVRIYGNTRYKTSIQTAEMLKKVRGVEKFEDIVLVSGEGFADGLSASYLAARLGAPILTTDGSKKSRYEAANAYILENLAPNGTVYIIGGQNAIPDVAVEGLSGVRCVRFEGNTRYATNLEVLKICGVFDTEVLIATGVSFPDSLSVSSTGLPLFLVNGEKGTLNNNQKSYLQTLSDNGCTFTIIGGVNAVSEDLKALIEEQTGKSADRIAGNTRYKTSVAIAERYFPGATQMILGYGDNFPDALCAGPLGYVMDAPVILTKSGSNAAVNAAKNYAAEKAITRGIVLGGPKLISDEDVRLIFSLPENVQILVK